MTSIFKFTLCWVFVLCTLLTVFQTSAYAIEVGKPAPAFSTQLLNSQAFTLASAKGEVVIIHFWATWCPSCREEMPILEHYYALHKSQGLRMIAVSLDDVADEPKMREVMQAYSFDAAFDRESQHKGYGRIWRLPQTFVIDRQGILRKDGGVGAANIDMPLLDKIVTPLLDSH